MRPFLWPAFRMLVMLTVLTGGVYPALVTLVARAAFSRQAEGSPIVRDGRIVGSSRIGQAFADSGDFWGRPTAPGVTPYDGRSSGGSNQGPTNPEWVRAVQARARRLRAADPDAGPAIPADLLTASASGLDPEISPAAAEYQVARVARARGLDPATVRALVHRHTAGPQWGFLGEPRVNVLPLNLDLDALAPPPRVAR